MTTKFEEINDLKKQLDDKLQQFGKEAFETAFGPFLKAHPEIEAIAWTQYTPYFNDGEPCVFDVHDPVFVSAQLCKQHGIGENWPVENAIEDWDCREIPELQAAFQELGKVWSQIDESIFLAVFGDHVRVMIRQDGTVDVEEYDHD